MEKPCGSSRFKLHLALVAAQALFAGFEVLSRVALDQGAGKTSFTFYRNCLASILSFPRLCYLFFLGFLGVTMNQLCYLVGLGLTSVMFASAIRNSIPIMTFLLACGALIGLVGSLVLSMYKGPVVLSSRFSVFHANSSSDQSHQLLSDNHVQRHTLHFFTTQLHFNMVSWHLGAIFLILSGFSFALFLILQAPVLKTYRAPVTFASISCFSSVLQLPILAAAFEPKWKLWRSMSVGEALCIVYAGAIGSGIVSGVQSWAVHGGGPVVVAAYQPLETLITACLSYFFLKESLHLGTLLGGLTIVAGLYMLVWGQNQERKRGSQIPGTDPKATVAAAANPSDAPRQRKFLTLLKKLTLEQARVVDESEWIEKTPGVY